MRISTTLTGAANAVAPVLAAAIEPLIGGELPIRLIAWDGSVAGPEAAPVVWLRSPDALRRILSRPTELGAAQAYVCGDIDVDGDLGFPLSEVWPQAAERRLRPAKPSPAALKSLRVIAARLGALDGPLPPPATEARPHSVSRDRAAIRHSHEMPREFYRLILDPSMTYSCAYWDNSRTNCTLAQAQIDKLDRICRKIGLHEQPGMWLLDVECGWGSLSLLAAEKYGAQVVGLTLAPGQKGYIDAALAERGLQDRVEIRVEDYRALTDGLFDAAASIEMGEHVGETDYPIFTSILHASVRPGGRVLVNRCHGAAAIPATDGSSNRSSPPTCTCVRSAKLSRCFKTAA